MTSTTTQHARVHGYLFIAMDDDGCGNPEFCHDRAAVLEAVKRSCFSNPESLDDDHLKQCEGMTDSLIEDGFITFEGDPPLHLYKLHPPAQPSGLRFPVALRKMWSGSEVQAWLDQQGELIRVADIPEGCTPTDARVLREANHKLATQVQHMHHTLTAIANGAMDITIERRVLRDAALAATSAEPSKAEGWLAMWSPVSAKPADRKASVVEPGRADEAASGGPSEPHCPHCAGSGTVRAMTAHLGPDDYEYDEDCAVCVGSGAAELKEVIESLGYFERQLFPGAAPTQYVRRSEVLKVIAARALVGKGGEA